MSDRLEEAKAEIRMDIKILKSVDHSMGTDCKVPETCYADVIMGLEQAVQCIEDLQKRLEQDEARC